MTEGDERRAGMSELNTTIALLQQTVERDFELTRKVHDRLFGNSHEGLVTTVAKVEGITQENRRSITILQKSIIGLLALSGLGAALVKVLT